MTDQYHCTKFKSHGKSERRFSWELQSTGDWRAFVDCLKCDPPLRIGEITDTEAYSALLPPKPPKMATLL